MRSRAMLFDLDGTLLDTAADITHALNTLRAERDLPALPLAAVRPHVSHGATAVVHAAFPDAAGEAFAALRRRFFQFYAAHLAVHTRLFPGFEPVLAALEERRMKWGVVTNKPGFLTEPLLARLELTARCACIVSGDTLPQRKPHPAQLLHAAARLGLNPAECIYVGDAERDVQAGRAAGMRTVVATFGYLRATDRPADWCADALIETPHELLRWLPGAH